MSRALRCLQDDGLELLGTVRVGTTVVLGDPVKLPAAPGTGAWHGVAVRAGSWTVLGRAWGPDPDLLEEIVWVRDACLDDFYDLYDTCVDAAACLLPTARLAILDGALRVDAGALIEIGEADPDALPWMLERGCVVAGIAQNPVRVFQPPGADADIVCANLGPSPGSHARTVGFVMDQDES